MTTLDKVRAHLAKRFPEASLDIDAGDTSAFLDVRLNDYIYIVSWRPRGGFGLTVDQDPVLGQRPDEFYRSTAAVQRRLTTLLNKARRTKPLAKSA